MSRILLSKHSVVLICVCIISQVCRYPERFEGVLNLEMELQAVFSHQIQVLGPELGSSAKAATLLATKSSLGSLKNTLYIFYKFAYLQNGEESIKTDCEVVRFSAKFQENTLSCECCLNTIKISRKLYEFDPFTSLQLFYNLSC